MIGGRTRARTWDPLIKSQLLYQLSYAPVLPSAGEPARRGSLSKGGKECPAAQGARGQPKEEAARWPGGFRRRWPSFVGEIAQIPSLLLAAFVKRARGIRDAARVAAFSS